MNKPLLLLSVLLMGVVSCGDTTASPDVDKIAETAQALDPSSESGAASQGVKLNSDHLPPGAGVAQQHVPRQAPDMADDGEESGPASQEPIPFSDPSVGMANEPIPTTPSQILSFDGISQTNLTPPDPTMAAGPSDVMVAVNAQFAIYNKSGLQLSTSSLNAWFANVLPNPSTGILIFDPKLIYDAVGARFILVALAKRDSDQLSRILISVSDNNTAVGSWCNFWSNGRLNGSTDTGFWADYPSVGQTNNAIIVSANMFSFANVFQYAKVRAFPKSQLYNTSCPGFSYFDNWNLHNANGSIVFTAQPANSYFASNQTYLVNSGFGTSNQLTLWSMTTTAANPPGVTLSQQATLTSNFTFSNPPDAQQPGTAALIDTLDDRLLNAVYRSSGLWTTHTTGCHWSGDTADRSCVRWYNINPNTNTITQQQNFGASGFYYYNPSITADSTGNAWLNFNRSASTEFASIRYTGRKSTDATSTMQSSALLIGSSSCYTPTRWGDFSGISMDPDGTAWMYNEYVGSGVACSNTWRTRVAHVGLP